MTSSLCLGAAFAAFACAGKVVDTGGDGLGVESGEPSTEVAASGDAGPPTTTSTSPTPTTTSSSPTSTTTSSSPTSTTTSSPTPERADASIAPSPAQDAGAADVVPADGAMVGLGEVTSCSATGSDAPCLAPGAVCWNEPGQPAPCADVSDPVCTCMEGPCECWGHFGMIGPPYPDSPATTCSSTGDMTTCAAAGALCWSVHADVADLCSNYAAPVCDCDDVPCRCWADVRSRFE